MIFTKPISVPGCIFTAPGQNNFLWGIDILRADFEPLINTALADNVKRFTESFDGSNIFYKELACNKANDILNQAREESKILIEKNKNKVDAEVVKFIDENKESDDKLIDHSRSNVENAVDAIMKFII